MKLTQTIKKLIRHERKSLQKNTSFLEIGWNQGKLLKSRKLVDYCGKANKVILFEMIVTCRLEQQ